jgi:hypothetical protein
MHMLELNITDSQLNTYVEQSPAAVHTGTHWNIIGHSIPAPLPVFLPSSIFPPPLSDCTFVSGRTKLVYVLGVFKTVQV